MAPIDLKGLELKVSDEERKVLHNMIDRMCDEGKLHLMWEAFFKGDEPFTFKRKRICLTMGISDEDVRA